MKSVGWMWLFEIHCIFISFQHLRNLQNLFSIWIVLFVVPFHRICFSLHSRHSYLKACKGSKLNYEPLWKIKEEGGAKDEWYLSSPHSLPSPLFFFSPPLNLSPVFAHPRRTHLLARLLDLPFWKMERKRLQCRLDLSEHNQSNRYCNQCFFWWDILYKVFHHCLMIPQSPLPPPPGFVSKQHLLA